MRKTFSETDLVFWWSDFDFSLYGTARLLTGRGGDVPCYSWGGRGHREDTCHTPHTTPCSPDTWGRSRQPLSSASHPLTGQPAVTSQSEGSRGFSSSQLREVSEPDSVGLLSLYPWGLATSVTCCHQCYVSVCGVLWYDGNKFWATSFTCIIT